MNTAWLPHWTTLLALGCGVAGALYPGLPSAPRQPRDPPRDFQEKHVQDISLVFFYGFFVLSMVLLGAMDAVLAVFLLIGWSRSHWGWSAAGTILLLWIIGRLGRLWHRLPAAGKVNPADPDAKR